MRRPLVWSQETERRQLGIVGMVERAEAMGGHLAVASSPGRGTLVRATVPIPPS